MKNKYIVFNERVFNRMCYLNMIPFVSGSSKNIQMKNLVKIKRQITMTELVHFDIVGSFLRPEELKQARDKFNH